MQLITLVAVGVSRAHLQTCVKQTSLHHPCGYLLGTRSIWQEDDLNPGGKFPAQLGKAVRSAGGDMALRSTQSHPTKLPADISESSSKDF